MVQVLKLYLQNSQNSRSVYKNIESQVLSFENLEKRSEIRFVNPYNLNILIIEFLEAFLECLLFLFFIY